MAQKCVRTLGSLHLTGFCRAVMYVLKEKLGLEDRYLLMEPDAKLGEFLFNEIMATAFRISDLDDNDLKEISNFKDFFTIRILKKVDICQK